MLQLRHRFFIPIDLNFIELASDLSLGLLVPFGKNAIPTGCVDRMYDRTRVAANVAILTLSTGCFFVVHGLCASTKYLNPPIETVLTFISMEDNLFFKS